MKKLLVFVLFTSFVAAQSGIVEYSVVSAKVDTKKETGEDVKKMIESLNNENDFKFELKFTKSNSTFLRIKKLDEVDTKNYMLNVKLILIGYKDTYVNKLDGKVYYSKDNFLIEQPQIKTEDWNVLSETKTISGYLCYKAVYTETYTNRQNKQIKRDIIAWFCPQLPYSYGPLKYIGLPGLILELNYANNIYIATKINLNTAVEVSIPKLKIISQDDYSVKLKSNSQF